MITTTILVLVAAAAVATATVTIVHLCCTSKGAFCGANVEAAACKKVEPEIEQVE